MDIARMFFDQMLNQHGIECKPIVCRRAVRLKETRTLDAHVKLDKVELVSVSSHRSSIGTGPSTTLVHCAVEEGLN